jgi:hypothetical protein
MAGTVTVTRQIRDPGARKKVVERVVVDWTSDASGNADSSITDLYGWLVKMVTDPGAVAPTDNYDITLVDENSADALEGAGADRDTANTETVYPIKSGAQTPVLLCGTHTFTVANAGNAKSGTAVLYIVTEL